MKEDPVDKDEYTDETVQMDVLMEEWEKFLEESIQPFDLVPRDFHGVLDEKILRNVMSSTWGLRGYKAEIEHEYPDLKDLYAEQVYMKYSTALYNFFQTMGYPRKTDARAEVGQNDKYFWDAFVKRVEKTAVENVWDLFDYDVALVYGNPYGLSFEKATNRTHDVYSVVKNGVYRDFINNPVVQKADRLIQRIEKGHFDHVGNGFVAVFINGSEIVKNLMTGVPNIISNAACVGIHDWKTGEGTVQFVRETEPVVALSIAASYVDDPEIGIMRHRAGTRARHERKKVV
jgi:hypothetical protein